MDPSANRPEGLREALTGVGLGDGNGDLAAAAFARLMAEAGTRRADCLCCLFLVFYFASAKFLHDVPSSYFAWLVERYPLARVFVF